MLLLILKLLGFFFEWVGSWCSVTRAVIFFLMNGLFEEKCNFGCPKTINKFGSNSLNRFGWKSNNFDMLNCVKLAKLLDKESATFHLLVLKLSQL